jgi:1-acyl-sn-glycerol-3-phosphate acyltransferase
VTASPKKTSGTRTPSKARTKKTAPFAPPSTETFDWLAAPMRAWFAPKLLGREHVHADRPALYVGNHSIYGVIDLTIFAAELYREKRIYLRCLADASHFALPLWGDLLTRLGAVEASRAACADLMKRRQHVLVLPGGGREACRRKGERYKLIWKARTGFARMAIRHASPVVPFAQVGADDAFDILVDGDDIMRSPVGSILKSTGIADAFLGGGDAILPLSRGLGLTAIPRPERFYFSLLAPIDTSIYGGRDDDDTAVYDLRDRVRDAVRDEIARLREYRKVDREISFVRRLINRFG